MKKSNLLIWKYVIIANFIDSKNIYKAIMIREKTIVFFGKKKTTTTVFLRYLGFIFPTWLLFVLAALVSSVFKTGR